jgi:hypothetical protein
VRLDSLLRERRMCHTNQSDMAKRKSPAEEWGIELPQPQSIPPISVRLSKDDLRKLTLLGEKVDVGPSTMARLIIEKFIKEHDPDQKKGGSRGKKE